MQPKLLLIPRSHGGHGQGIGGNGRLESPAGSLPNPQHQRVVQVSLRRFQESPSLRGTIRGEPRRSIQAL
jgi:hypothetical protein